MALNWNVEKVEDWEALQADQHEQVVTQTVVFATMSVGIGRITEENWKEFVARFDLVQDVDGTFMYDADGPYRVTAEDVRRRVGLTTNVANETRPQWMKRWVGQVLDEKKRYARA